MKVRWTQRAESDLFEIGDYIAADSPKAARGLLLEIQIRVRQVAKTPYASRIVPERKNETIREVRVRSYRIIFRVTKTSIDVLTVFEGHRLFPEDSLSED